MTINKKSLFGVTKSFCVATVILAGVLASNNTSFVYASHIGVPAAIQVDSINGLDPATISCPDNPLPSGVVTIIGSGEGSTPPGRVEQYGVSIDWGDGSPIEDTFSTFNPPSGKHKDFVFQFTSPHVYTDGSYTISISLFHSERSGNDNQIDSTVTLDICIRNPIAPAIQIDLINGQAPETFSCPDNPIAGTVAFSGIGEGSTPPGDVADRGVLIDWGDGTPTQEAFATFTPSTGANVDFVLAYNTPTHLYAVDDSYIVSISLFHLDASQNMQIDATDTISICTFNPVAATLQVDLINGQAPETFSCDVNPITGAVTIDGSGVGSAPPGVVEQWGVLINWGDGSPGEEALSTFNPATGVNVNFTYDFQTLAHSFPQDDSFPVSISLFYSDTSGDHIVLTETVDICIFTPVAPALQVDLINGQAPETFSCADNPITGSVTIGGSGVGSADGRPGGPTPSLDVGDYFVTVDWGDGSPAEQAASTFNPASGVNVNFMNAFQTSAHNFAQDGSYIVSLSLVYADPSGAGDVIVATETAEVCIFTPVAPALQVDSINGQEPTSFSCDVNPLTGSVTIDGSGVGSADGRAGGPTPSLDAGDFFVTVDWGDGSPVEQATSTFIPATGTNINFAYNFQTLENIYTQDGTYPVTLSLVYTDPLGAGDVIAVTETIDVCIDLPKGFVTGEVTDEETGLPLFGAIVEDITDGFSLLGSFPGGSTYVIKPLPGLRTIRVSAPGWQDGIAQVPVVVDQVTIQDFALAREETALNVVIVDVPIGKKNNKVFLIPECIEAVVDGVVVQVSCVHFGRFFLFVGLPDGETIFRGMNTFYEISSDEVLLDNDEHDPGDDAPNRGDDIKVHLPANVPPARAARVPVITGSVNGVTSDGVSSVATTIFAEFEHEGLPVTVSTDSNVDTGVFVVNLLPAGEVVVTAHGVSNSLRSADTAATVVGGESTQKNLVVFPFDPVTENFVPVVASSTLVAVDEDNSVVVDINNFVVTDLNDPFSSAHTLDVYPGTNYTLSAILPGSTQINPDPDFHGSLIVPVTVSDGTNNSAPFPLTVNVGSVPDAIVYVDFDTGQLRSAGGLGTVDNPLLTIGEALGEVAAEGTILIKGLSTSTEPPLIINQPVTLENNNAAEEVVRIDPSPARQAEFTPVSGFVTRSRNPK